MVAQITKAAKDISVGDTILLPEFGYFRVTRVRTTVSQAGYAVTTLDFPRRVYSTDPFVLLDVIV